MGVKVFRLFIILVLFSFGLQAAPVTVIRHVPPEEGVDIRKLYFKDLLVLALEKSKKKYGEYLLDQVSTPMYQARAFKSLEQNQIDVVWSMTSNQREEQAQAVYIPLMKGLLGYRVFIIHRDKRDLFNNVGSLQDLADLSAIQGHDWPDTKILRHNGLKVITDFKYLAIFDHIDRGRYDYFPRGVLEAWEELASTKHNHLMVDPNILLVYPAPVYFFVRKGDDALAERLAFGLKQAHEDGSFDHLLFSHPVHKEAFKKLAVSHRQVFYLSNPLLSDKTPLNEASYWLSVEQLTGMK